MLAAIVAFAAAFAAGYYLGQRSAGESGTEVAERVEAPVVAPVPRSEIASDGELAAERIGQLEAELATANTRHEVDRAALEMVRQDLAGQREQIADLDEGLRFYRSLMVPGEIAQGFSLRGIELVAREVSGVYGYRLVAQQEARKHEAMRGEVQITILGSHEGQPFSYPLAELVQDMKSNSIPLRFLYFQAIEGELVIPDGFEPQTVEVVAELSSPRKMEVRESYPWQLQEKFTHVGK